MATLSQTAYLARKIIKYGLIGLVALLVIRSVFLSIRTYLNKVRPKPLPPPTVAFGKLPKLQFPQKTNLPSLTLKVETISGELPKLSDRAKVFFMPQASVNFLAWDKTKIWARSLGFTQDPQETGKFSYRFVSETTPKTTLDVDVLTRNFSLVYDWKNDLEIFSPGNLPPDSQTISLAKAFLRNAGVLTDDLNQGRTKLVYFKYSDGNLSKTPFFSEADLAQVNFFRQDIEQIKVLPPNPQDVNVSVKVSSSNDKTKSIIEAHFIHFPVSLENSATYPLKDVSTAWTLLAKGEGFVANLGNNPSGNITVTDAYLAYYDSDQAQNFLQPVIVFEGNNDFFAYVPAVSENWLER